MTGLAFGSLGVDELCGPLAVLLADPDVTDVLVNGPGPVRVDRGEGVALSGVELSTESEVRRLATRLVAAAGRRLDAAAPYADARLPDGTRVHAILPPLSVQGTSLSLRLPPRRTFALSDLVAARSLPAAGADLVAGLVAARVGFLITGGTGTGKTTVLSTLLSLVPRDERVVVVEDCAELRPRHPQVVRLESRAANSEGAGEVALAELVRQALRMRPDRLVVGEVRGAEVLDLLGALNTGHEGGCGTIHANRSEQLPARVEALAVRAQLPRRAAHSLLGSAVEAVIHLDRPSAGRRRVAGIGVLRTDADGFVRVVPAYRFVDDRVHRCAGAEPLEVRLRRPP